MAQEGNTEQGAPVPVLAPLMIVPATALGVAPDPLGAGAPMVRIQLSNAAVFCSMPLTIDQAREHVAAVQQAITEAAGLVIADGTTPPSGPRGLVL